MTFYFQNKNERLGIHNYNNAGIAIMLISTIYTKKLHTNNYSKKARLT